MSAIRKPPSSLLMLQARFPAAFGNPRRPLAVGIREEIRAILPVDELSEQKLQQALYFHTGRITYLQACLADGARRLHLDGSDAGEVDDEGRRMAGEKLAAAEARKQARKQEEAERKASTPPQPVKKKPKPVPEKRLAPPPKPAKAVPVVQVKKRRIPDRP